MSVAATSGVDAAERSEASFRYGAVLLLVLSLVIFQIAAPAASWALAVDAALAGSALTVAVATSREGGAVRRRQAVLIGTAGIIVVVLIAAAVIGPTATFVIVTLLLVAIPITLVGGLLRLINQEGVIVEAVAGALAIYLLVGLLFASIVAFVSHVEGGAFFKQGTEADSIDVYYSFTVLTTTGFGDYTARTSVGHALAVLEMLTGQLYLVTVIGIVVGNFAGRRLRSESR